MTRDVAALPFIDEHQVLVSASPRDVWRHLGKIIGRSRFANRVAAHVLGAVPRSASGDPLTRGAVLPGFAVRELAPGDHVVLGGQHRFSEYALILTLARDTGGTRLSARTHARFPGLRGHLYPTLVISSGAHKFLLMRLLHDVRRAAEAEGKLVHG